MKAAKSSSQFSCLVTPSHQNPSTTLRVSTVPRHLFASADSDVTIWCLPEELLIYLLKGLHIRDLLNMRSVHPAFRDIIDANSAVWQSVSFDDTWPSLRNINHFERAAQHHNIESLLKLAIAYLYNEGLPHDEEGQRMRTSGMMAASMFCEVETLTPDVTPFTWLFIRPPWSAGRASCKEFVFKHMLLYVKQHQDAQMALCVSQILRLFDDHVSQARMIRYLTSSANGGNKSAMFLLWSEKNKNNVANDHAVELQAVRELRDIASLGDVEAQLALCRYYCTTRHSATQFVQHLGVSRELAVSTVRSFFQSSSASNAHLIFTYHPDISNTMRYILIDWLVEVAGMKEFSTHTLHVAVSVVDRFLRVHRMTRNHLQLLGVAAMVLCSRFLGKDIITIREAAWLTDNTYKYENVVRMMGEIVATLRGKIRVLTSLDYLYMLEEMVRADARTCCLAEYACETALLHAELSRYKRAEMAATCLLFARLVLKQHYPWSGQLEEFTGFTLSSLTKCIIHMFSKCFVSGKVTDHRDVELEAVKQRYSLDSLCNVSQIKLPVLEELCSLLGVSGYVFVENDLQIRYKPSLAQRQAPSITTTLRCNAGGSAFSAPSSGVLDVMPTSTTRTGGMEESGGYEAGCSIAGSDLTLDGALADVNANYTDVKSRNWPGEVSMVMPNVGLPLPPGVDLVTPGSATTSCKSRLQMYRRAARMTLASTSQTTSDVSSEDPIPRELRPPRKPRQTWLHDPSGRHNIPCLPMAGDDVAMQESPVKLESADCGIGSPMKID